MRLLTCFWLVLSGFAVDLAAAPAEFQLHPSLEMTLFAREPDVVDPVAITFDEAGRVYVIEMRDYPYGIGPDLKPGGTVRLLEDQNGDGQADRSTVFASGLSFPTSIAAWQGGVFIAAPPEIVFLKDTNGDGKADVREVVWKGFTLGVTDGNMNGLRWALDNRIHGCNGGNGGRVSSSLIPDAPIDLRDLDFSFDPRTGSFDTTHRTSGGFGLVFDDWGRSYSTHNVNHIQHRVLLARDLNRFHGFPPARTTVNISDHGSMARIYPVSAPETRVNHPEQSGHFSSAGGLGYLGGTYFIPALRNSVLVCDVVGNLVHRDWLHSDGPSFAASRGVDEQTQEFFASRDSRFRPVAVELGPDGAIYLADMQRDVIEHPDYIPQKVREKLDIRAGENRGRIYRMVPRHGLPRVPHLRDLSLRQLVDELSNWNQTRRLMAQRILIERQEENVAPVLRELAEHGAQPLGRLHALWTLEGLKQLDNPLLLRALSDPNPGVRENALRLAERHLPGTSDLRHKIPALAEDSDIRVRFQAALTAGAFTSANAADILVRTLKRDARYRWSRWAVLSSLGTGLDVLAALEALVEDELFKQLPAADQEESLRELADLAVARPSVDRTKVVARVIAAGGNLQLPMSLRLALMSGTDTGLARSGAKGLKTSPMEKALSQYSQIESPALLAAAWRISRRIGFEESAAQRDALDRAKVAALDAALPLNERIASIELLGLGSVSEVGQTLFSLLDALQPRQAQQTAMRALRQFNDPSVAAGLIERWNTLAPEMRPRCVDLLLQRIQFHPFLMDAIESEKIKLGELNLDLEQRRRLLRNSTPEIKTRAAKFIGDEEYSNRKEIVDQWLQVLPKQGESKRGRAIFEKSCASCHSVDNLGHAVGPDLRSLAHRSVEDLLSNILDPNMAIQPNYVSFNIELDSGELESGILRSQTSDAVTLLQAESKKVMIPRAQIKRLQSSGLSLMPEGLESGYTPQDLRDLISFMQEPVGNGPR